MEGGGGVTVAGKGLNQPTNQPLVACDTNTTRGWEAASQSNRRWKMWLPSNKDSAAASTCRSGEGRKECGGGGGVDGWIIDKMLLWCKATFADGSDDTNPNLCD